MINIKIPKKKNKKFIEEFFIKKGLQIIVDESKKKIFNNKNQTYLPQLDDLYNLYQYVLLNKRTTVLEFGSGWSSLIFNLALNELKDKYHNDIKSLKRNNPFELFILESNKKYMTISKNRINKFNKLLKIKKPIKVHYCYSDVNMTLYEGKIACEFIKLPLCNPDFVYLDGPDRFNIKKDINGINTSHKDMMPMSCDILKFEYFYIPGTIIVVDGRGANSKFLKDHLKRNWKYLKDKAIDQHLFWLDDSLLGKYNKLQIDFYKK